MLQVDVRWLRPLDCAPFPDLPAPWLVAPGARSAAGLAVPTPRRHWLALGIEAIEALLAEHPSTGSFCEGDTPSMADVCLVPQVYNARRFAVDLTPFPTVRRIDEHCLALPAFDRARPENQPDAPRG